MDKPWMKLYVGDIAILINGMTHQEKGVLLDLIILMWDQGFTTVQKAERILKKPMAKWGRGVLEVLTSMDGGAITLDFLLKERELADARTADAKRAAEAKWAQVRARKMDAVAVRAQCEGNAVAMPVEVDGESESEKMEDAALSPQAVTGVVAHLKSILGADPQGGMDQNRGACRILIEKMRELYPEADPVQKAKDLITYGRKTFLGPMMSDFRWISKNYLRLRDTIIKEAKEGKLKPEAPPVAEERHYYPGYGPNGTEQA